MLDLIWDLFQQGQVESAERTANRAEAVAGMAKAETGSLDMRIDRLALVTAAMWELTRERLGVTDHDLVRKMREIDARDGVEDGRVGFAPVKCHQCARTISEKDANCLYCGAENRRRRNLIFP